MVLIVHGERKKSWFTFLVRKCALMRKVNEIKGQIWEIVDRISPILPKRGDYETLMFHIPLWEKNSN